jgi:HAD superfamily phosphoserine phosphatase-like hydrolase
MQRVFVSSTVQDLARYRKAVSDSILQLGATVVAKEWFGARDERPKEECLRVIREECDVFVGFYAHRYGFIPDGDDLSITEQEYIQAVRARRPSLVYRVERDYRWPKAAIETGPGAGKLTEFLARIGEDRIYSTFTTPDSLAADVAADLGRYFLGDVAKTRFRRGMFHRPPAAWVSKADVTHERYKLVVFDLDGTLIRGNAFEFSWEAIWNTLMFAPEVAAALKRDYNKRAAAAAGVEERIDAYATWCERAVEMFRARRLSRDRLRQITAGMTLTVHCREAMARLRDAGIAIAIVSGGVNTFLEDAFPDYRDYVDFVFLNELTFGADGIIDGVVATSYDFQGKAEAIDLLCTRVGCSTQEVVFVGDRFNDLFALLKAGLGIAYPDNDDQAADAAEVVIQEDDLLLILPHVLRAH